MKQKALLMSWMNAKKWTTLPTDSIHTVHSASVILLVHQQQSPFPKRSRRLPGQFQMMRSCLIAIH